VESCPICRANLNGASTCRRCRADLRHVQAMERLGQTLAGAAMLALATGQKAAARHLLRRARAVHATPTVRTLARLLAEPQQR
jgi:hypothetical protein